MPDYFVPNSPGPVGPGNATPRYTPPWWVEPLIDAGMAVAGGAYSNRQNEKAADRAYRQQKEFAQMGIRWRVEDAKAAGLHPLYALGAQPLQFSPTFAMDSVGPAIQQAGQSISRAVGAQANSLERQAQLLSLKLLESQIGETDARKLLARAEAWRALNESKNPAFPPVNMPESALIGEAASTIGGAELTAPKVNMSRPGSSGGIVAGPANPSLREYALPDGFKIMLPDASSLGEALEPLSESWALAYGVYRENARVYGDKWTREFIRRYQPQWITRFDDWFLGAQKRKEEWYKSPKRWFNRSNKGQTGSARERRGGGL